MEMLDHLRKAWATCTRCPLHETRTSVVFGSGAPTARLMIVGEAPGAEEDQLSIPFVGRAGQMLSWAISQAGHVRREVFVVNSLACRPPGNRDPKREEQEACWPRLVNTVDIVAPRCLLLVGKPAAQLVLGREVKILTERGQSGSTVVGGREVKFVLAVHPSAILRTPLELGGKRMRQELVEDVKLAWKLAHEEV